MEKEIKSGKAVLDEFFSEIQLDENLDSDTVSAVVDLYNKGKLTDSNLTNALSTLREEKGNGENK